MGATKKFQQPISRRDFFKSSALLGGSGLLAETLASCTTVQQAEGWQNAYDLDSAEHVLYSVCLQCHTDCPIKVRIQNGVAVKMDGNPYGMQTMNPAIPYQTDLASSAKIDGGICPKGQAGLQSLYDPYRLTKVLKRAGKRGENKWQVISFDQAIREIVSGGKLFSHVPGEENRIVPGLKDLYKARDPKQMKAMASDAKKVGQGKMKVSEFQSKYRHALDQLIDPDFPDLGPVNNQFVFQAGRIEHGRKEFAKRWLNGGFGSTNWFEHTTICEQSHHIAYQQITNQYVDGKWTKGKHHLKPDFYNSEFVVFFGTGAFEANFGPPMLANQVTNQLVAHQLKIAVVDPRFSKTAAKAWKWLPVKPGSDAAVAWGMIRWLLDHEGYDSTYLKNANQAAAKLDDETTWANATWLVKIEPDGPGSFLRANEIGLGSEHDFVAIVDGKPVKVNPYDTRNPVEGTLDYAGSLQGIPVKSAFRILKEYAFQRTVADWAALTGVPADQIIALAREFAKHGKKSVAELYRGAVQHTNGYYNAQAIITLNLLVGNADWKGGLSKGGGHWHEDGSKKGQPFNLKSGLHPGKLAAFGHKINREKSRYEDSTLYQKYGYPAKRPWFPLTGNVYQEILPSIEDGYPYSVKALFLHKGTPAFAAPAGDRAIRTLTNVEKLPLFFACDIVIGETSMYADYLFPDTAIWERWGTPHITPACPTIQSKVRQPVIEPLVEKVTVYGTEMPVSMEAIMLGIAEQLRLPGFGPDGFGPGMPLTRREDFYLKMVANIAAGDKPGQAVPNASEAEYKTFLKARRHLSAAVFDPERFQQAVTDASGKSWWKKVVYVLNRGGRFEDFDVYRNSGKRLPHLYKAMFNLYVEPTAMTRHSYTGKRFSGLGVFEGVKGFNDTLVKVNGYPLSLITFKEIIGGQSRTLPNDYWLASIHPENRVLINTRTAREIGVADGDTVKVTSPTNPDGVWDLQNGTRIPVKGKVQTLEGLRPGVVAISWHYGHWAYGANDVIIDQQKISGEEKRRKGLCPNALMATDPVLKNVCLQDLIGGSASFYDSFVKLEKVS